MNKLKNLTVLLIIALTLTGCMAKVSEYKSTAAERAIFRVIGEGTAPNLSHSYNEVIHAINSRDYKPSEGDTISMCVYSPLIRLATLQLKDHADFSVTFEETYQGMYGVSFEEVCNPDSVKSLREIEEEKIGEAVPTQERQHVVTIDEGEAVLSHNMMEHLIDAIKACPRAKAKYMTLTSQGINVSVKLYREMGGIIHKCQSLEIEKNL